MPYNKVKRYMSDRFDILLIKAEKDLKAATNLLLLSDSPEEAIVFHLQQMVEKLLKAALIFYKLDYSFTHDLIFLIETLEPKDKTFSQYYDLAEKLGPFAVLARYEEGIEIDIPTINTLLPTTLLLREYIQNLSTRPQ